MIYSLCRLHKMFENFGKGFRKIFEIEKMLEIERYERLWSKYRDV